MCDGSFGSTAMVPNRRAWDSAPPRVVSIGGATLSVAAASALRNGASTRYVVRNTSDPADPAQSMGLGRCAEACSGDTGGDLEAGESGRGDSRTASPSRGAGGADCQEVSSASGPSSATVPGEGYGIPSGLGNLETAARGGGVERGSALPVGVGGSLRDEGRDDGEGGDAGGAGKLLRGISGRCGISGISGRNSRNSRAVVAAGTAGTVGR